MPGRPKIDNELRELIHRIATENKTWGAGRVYGELLKLGFSISERTAAKFMPERPGG